MKADVDQGPDFRHKCSRTKKQSRKVHVLYPLPECDAFFTGDSKKNRLTFYS